MLKQRTLTPIQKHAGKYLAFFETKKRDNGESFYVLSDNRPDALLDLVHKAHHNGMLPDDYIYEYVYDALERITSYDDLDNAENEIESDIYNSDLLKWLGSNLNRAGYCDEYVKDFGISGKDFDLFSVIGGGQYLEKTEVFRIVRNTLEEEIK